MAAAESEDLGQQRDDIVTAAAVCEMVHMATLVHDDVLDDAQVRRRGATINQLRGNEAAVMLGDYLISHAYHLCSSLGRADISRAVAHATNTVCEGELQQLSNRHNLELSEAAYFEYPPQDRGVVRPVLRVADPAATPWCRSQWRYESCTCVVCLWRKAGDCLPDRRRHP